MSTALQTKNALQFDIQALSDITSSPYYVHCRTKAYRDLKLPILQKLAPSNAHKYLRLITPFDSLPSLSTKSVTLISHRLWPTQLHSFPLHIDKSAF